jgi:hypothetical protein
MSDTENPEETANNGAGDGQPDINPAVNERLSSLETKLE